MSANKAYFNWVCRPVQQPQKVYLFFLLLICSPIGYAQTVVFHIQNSAKEPVAEAQVLINQNKKAYTNAAGLIDVDVTGYNRIYVDVLADGYKLFNAYYPKVKFRDRDTILITLKPVELAELSEVVVTAGRKIESMNTIPSSISVLNQKEIQAQMEITTNLSAILGNTIPGLGTATGKANNAGQTLRGRQALVLVDGIPQTTPLMNSSRDIRSIDPAAIERIEVIKGATSIYGNGSGGGIINYITKMYNGPRKVTGNTSLGTSFNPIHGDETLGYRVSQTFSGRLKQVTYTVGGAIDYTGLQRDAKGLALGQTDGLSNTYQNNAFVKANWNINDKQHLSVFYNFYGSTQHAKYISKLGRYGETPTVGVVGKDPGEPAGTPYNHNAMLKYSRTGLYLNSTLDVTAYLTAFRSMNRYIENGTAWYGPGQTKINSNKKGFRLDLNTPFQIKRFNGELSYGLDILNDITNQDLTDGRVYIPNMNMVNIAPFAQLKLDVLQNLIFKGGVRFENATVHVKDYRTISIGPNDEGSVAVKGGKVPYNAVMFNAGLRYNRWNIFSPFLSYSQGFAINELGRILRRADMDNIQKLETDPIITNNYEVGFSSHYSIFNFSAAYYLSTSNLGVNLVDKNGFLFPQREPEDVWGYELALDVKLSKQLTLGGNYAFVEGKAKFEDGSKVYLNGSRIAPPKATAFLAYQPTDKWNLQLFWVHTGGRNRFERAVNGRYKNSEGPVKKVDVFNFSGSYAITKQLRLSAGIENLFNTTYYPVVSQYRALEAEYFRAPGIMTNLNIHYTF